MTPSQSRILAFQRVWRIPSPFGAAALSRTCTQEGVLGLREGIARFNPYRGLRLSTYAIWWIRQRIARSIDNDLRTIRVPVHVNEEARTIRRRLRDPRQADDILKPAGRTLSSRDSDILGWTQPIESLDELVTNRTAPQIEGSTIAEYWSTAADIDAQSGTNFLSAAIDEVLSRLDDRERDIIRRRFGLDSGETGDPRVDRGSLQRHARTYKTD